MATRAKVKPQAASLLDIQEIRREKAHRCKASFAYFLKQAWRVIEPARPFISGYHTEALCMHLQAISDGDLRKVVINIAPGHGKSSIVSVAFPAWQWTRYPYERFLCSSYALDLSIRDNRNCRALIESEWYQSLFSDVFSLASDQNVKSFFENDKRGYRLATAVRGAGTGKRGTMLIIDDPNNGMAGVADIDATVEWYGKTWASRLNDQDKGAMIIVCQRLHDKDLTSHVLSLEGWEHLNLPEEFEPSRKSYTSIGWEDPRTEEGELLCPKLLDKKAILNLKMSLGSMNYAAQYAQAPVPSSGGKFKQSWFRYFTTLYQDEQPYAYLLQTPQGQKSILVSLCRKFGTVDLAISEKQSADFTVFCVWAVTPDADLLLLHVFRDRVSNAEQIEQLKIVHARFKPDYWKIETVAYQAAFYQQAMAAGIPSKSFKPDRDKERRATTAAVWSENGKTYFAKDAPWLADVEAELVVFPKGAHDDIVDNYSIAADDVCMPAGVYAWSPESAVHEPAVAGQPPSMWEVAGPGHSMYEVEIEL